MHPGILKSLELERIKVIFKVQRLLSQGLKANSGGCPAWRIDAS